MLKRLYKFIGSLVMLLALALCIGIGIKNPTAITDLINFSKEEDKTIVEVPYFINFKTINEGSSGFKSQYFQNDSMNWYCSWGALATTDNSFILGWNAIEFPTYGSYSYKNEVMKNITLEDPNNQYYSFMLMDFDFERNHYVNWSFKPFESLTYGNRSKVHLIQSHDSGKSWKVLDTKANEELTKSANLVFEHTEENTIKTKTRYGMVLISDLTSARLEVMQFYTQRLSL